MFALSIKSIAQAKIREAFSGGGLPEFTRKNSLGYIYFLLVYVLHLETV